MSPRRSSDGPARPQALSGRLRRGLPPALLAVFALVLVLALAGCGRSNGSSSSSDTGRTTSTGPAGGPQQGPPGGQLSASQRAQLKPFADCLKQHGIDIPSGGPQGGGPPQQDATTRRALRACQGRLPQGVAPPGGVAG